MHKKYLIPALSALLLTACGNQGKDLSEIKDATPADSMMYYFGEMQASYYLQDAMTDTTLRSQEARKHFMDGFRAAMKMDEDNAAYNKGLQLGLRLALRLREFGERFNQKFSEEMLAEALEYYLQNDTLIDVVAAQKGFYQQKDRFELQAANKEIGDAKKALAKRGSEGGFVQVNDTLYALDVTASSSGRKFKDGDRIAVKLTPSTLEGKEIVIRQFPDSITLGEGHVPPVVREAIYTMTDGQTRQFMTTPRTLFGKRYATYGLPYDEPVVFTVKATLASDSEPAAAED